MEETYDNILPMNIKINVSYVEDEEENIIAIDKDEMRREFEQELKILENLNK